jgi:hypothetical protein
MLIETATLASAELAARNAENTTAPTATVSERSNEQPMTHSNPDIPRGKWKHESSRPCKQVHGHVKNGP